MATRGQFQIVRRFEAAADLTGHKYKAVFLSSGQVTVPAAAQGDGYDVVGVVQDEPDAQGKVGEVVVLGFTKVISGEAITAGDNLIAAGSDTASAAGRVLAATRNGTTEASEAIIGRALEDASGAGEWIEAFVFCMPCLVANRTG
jgi:hypothetical protein